jgi:hypothetical protein
MAVPGFAPGFMLPDISIGMVMYPERATLMLMLFLIFLFAAVAVCCVLPRFVKHFFGRSGY